MLEWPITWAGDEYSPVPGSWITHPVAVDRDECAGPRLFAVSVSVTHGGDRLRVRYTHPRQPAVLVREVPATTRDGETVVPRGLVTGAGWHRSLHPGASEPVDTRRHVESRHLRAVWGDRAPSVPTDADVRGELQPDGGVALLPEADSVSADWLAPPEEHEGPSGRLARTLGGDRA